MNSSQNPWREYRKRRNLALVAFLGYLPAVWLMFLATNAFFHTATPAFIVTTLWMVAGVLAGNWFIRFRCPRCGQPFFVKGWGNNPFARRCLHCKLPLNAPSWYPGSD